MHERIRECVLLSAETPQIGRSGRVPGTREMVISGTCYIDPYRVVGNTLQILSGLSHYPAVAGGLRMNNERRYLAAREVEALLAATKGSESINHG